MLDEPKNEAIQVESPRITIPENIDQLNANIATETLVTAVGGKSSHTLDNNAANDDIFENSSQDQDSRKDQLKVD